MEENDYELTPAPQEPRARELWLQHAVGHMLLTQVGGYAEQQMAKGLSTGEREAAVKAIHDTLYGLMMLIDGVSAPIRGNGHEVRLRFLAELIRPEMGDEVLSSFDLFEDGDGMCMGFHGWLAGDFGEPCPVQRKTGGVQGGGEAG